MPLFNILIFNKIISIVSDAIATYCRTWQRQGKFELTIIDKTLKIEFSLSIIELLNNNRNSIKKVDQNSLEYKS